MQFLRVFFTAIAFGASAEDAEEVLDLASAFGSEVPVVGELSGRFVDLFNGISSDLKFRLHSPGALFPVSQSLEVISSGHVAATFSISGYWQDRLPTAALFSSFPFGFDALERMAWLHEGNGLALYQQMYDRAGYNVKVIPCGMTPAETSGWFKKEIRSPEDLSGLKMRIFGYGGEVFQTFGVTKRLATADGIAHALKRGVLDAAEFSTLATDMSLGLQEHTSFVYFPGWHQPSTLFELLLNMDTWRSMDQQKRSLVQAACAANILESLVHAEAMDQRALDELKKKGKAQIKTWSPEMLEAFAQAWVEIAEEHSKDDKFFRIVWEDITAFRAEREEWSRAASRYFPRIQ